MKSFGIAVAALWAAFFAMSAHAQDQTRASAAPAVPKKIPSSVFAKGNSLAGPLLSPDGTKLAMRMFREGKALLGIQDLAAGKLKVMMPPEKGEIVWYRWAGDRRILVSLAYTVPWFDDEARATRLLVHDIETGQSSYLGDRKNGLEGDDVLYVDEAGGWLLLSIQKTIFDWPSVYRIDLATNKKKEVVRQQDSVWEWFADDRGVVRFGIGFQGKSWFKVYRKTEEERFRKVGRARYDDEKTGLELLHFGSDSDEGYVLSNEKTGRYAVYKYDFATGELGDLVFEDKIHDITAASLSEDGKGLKAVWYADDRERVVWFDEALSKHQAEIDDALKGRTNWIVSRSRDDKRMLVWTGAANNPGVYYLYEPAAGVMQRIAKLNDLLEPSQLSATQYVKYMARDGLEIPAYLTLPAGRARKDLPLIVMPHGGPYGIRDTLTYDREVQFLANRGYAVLQPNFRGSGGYGKDFVDKGTGQWGRQMQDDLDDGVDWLVKQGTVDPKRVCLVGTSYGGYAALWGATRNPERYRCGVSSAGVSDLKRQLRYSSASFASRRYAKDFQRRVQGEKEFDLDTVSPLRQVDRLQVPVLVVHGSDDQTVPSKQSSLYAAALKKAGKPHEYHLYQDEGHGVSAEANVKDWLDRLEAFLTTHNPAD